MSLTTSKQASNQAIKQARQVKIKDLKTLVKTKNMVRTRHKMDENNLSNGLKPYDHWGELGMSRPPDFGMG